jgi:hypothetical protein
MGQPSARSTLLFETEFPAEGLTEQKTRSTISGVSSEMEAFLESFLTGETSLAPKDGGVQTGRRERLQNVLSTEHKAA